MNNQGQANRGQEGTGGGRCKVKGGGGVRKRWEVGEIRRNLCNIKILQSKRGSGEEEKKKQGSWECKVWEAEGLDPLSPPTPKYPLVLYIPPITHRRKNHSPWVTLQLSEDLTGLQSNLDYPDFSIIRTCFPAPSLFFMKTNKIQ